VQLQFPLIQLPRKSEGGSISSYKARVIVSINSTSEEVRSLENLKYMYSKYSSVSINSTSEEVRRQQNVHLLKLDMEFPLIQLPRKSEVSYFGCQAEVKEIVSINSTSEEVRSSLMRNVLRNALRSFH